MATGFFGEDGRGELVIEAAVTGNCLVAISRSEAVDPPRLRHGALHSWMHRPLQRRGEVHHERPIPPDLRVAIESCCAVDLGWPRKYPGT